MMQVSERPTALTKGDSPLVAIQARLAVPPQHARLRGGLMYGHWFEATHLERLQPRKVHGHLVQM